MLRPAALLQQLQGPPRSRDTTVAPPPWVWPARPPTHQPLLPSPNPNPTLQGLPSVTLKDNKTNADAIAVWDNATDTAYLLWKYTEESRDWLTDAAGIQARGSCSACSGRVCPRACCGAPPPAPLRAAATRATRRGARLLALPACCEERRCLLPAACCQPRAACCVLRAACQP